MLELLLFLLNYTHPGRVEIGNITAVLRGMLPQCHEHKPLAVRIHTSSSAVTQ